MQTHESWLSLRDPCDALYQLNYCLKEESCSVLNAIQMSCLLNRGPVSGRKNGKATDYCGSPTGPGVFCTVIPQDWVAVEWRGRSGAVGGRSPGASFGFYLTEVFQSQTHNAHVGKILYSENCLALICYRNWWTAITQDIMLWCLVNLHLIVGASVITQMRLPHPFPFWVVTKEKGNKVGWLLYRWPFLTWQN